MQTNSLFFNGKVSILNPMRTKLFYFMMPFLLTGCVGSWISGHTGYINEPYPDIRTVPERKEASASRGLHEKNEEISRATDFKNLEQAREKIKARDQALREGAFPNSQKEKAE